MCIERLINNQKINKQINNVYCKQLLIGSSCLFNFSLNLCGLLALSARKWHVIKQSTLSSLAEKVIKGLERKGLINNVENDNNGTASNSTKIDWNKFTYWNRHTLGKIWSKQ